MVEPARRPSLLVVCLCAQWCGSCREYRSTFEQVAEAFPDMRFLWVDIEDQADLVDPIEVENFPTLFKQNFDAAEARSKSTTTAQGAYGDLQDLDKIQPNYPGMAAAIKQVRILLRIDQVAIDPKDLAQARSLVAQATRLVNTGNPAQLLAAQNQVRQALALDPRNAPAQDLSDRISLLLKPNVVTLTPTQVGELNAILDLLRAQRTLDALSQLTEFKAKYPGWDQPVRVIPAVEAVYREAP